MGRSASAAWPAVSMCVIPAACSVAAVPRMMKNAIRFENPIPEVGIPADAAQVLPRDRFRMGQQIAATVAGRDGLEILDFLGRLPEEQVRADRGPEHRHHHGDGVVIEVQIGKESALNDLLPRHVDREYHRHVREQPQRQPLQVAHVGFITQVDLQTEAGDPEEHRVQVRGSPDQQAQCLAHRGDVGRDVDGVRHQQQAHDAVQHRARENRFHVRGQSPTGDATESRADHLDADHQRVRENHGPQHLEPELRARLRVGRDAAGIVIRSPGDEARPDLLHPRMLGDAFDRFF